MWEEPWTKNGEAPSDSNYMSMVQYGTSNRKDVKTESSLQTSAGLTLKASDEFLGCGIDMSESFSFMHQKSRGTEKTVTVSTNNTWKAYLQNPLGSDGFALVTYPRFQNNKYDFQAYDGTSLGYTMNVITFEGVTTNWTPYNLASPGSPAPGQMNLDGLLPLYNSLSVADWANAAAIPKDVTSYQKMQDINGNPITPPTLETCNGIEQTFSISQTTVKTKSQETSLSMDASVGFSEFGCGASASVGAKFSFSGSTQSSVGSDFQLGLDIVQGGGDDPSNYLAGLSVQPYFLQILGPTVAGKGYLPDGFSGSRPWVITYDVTNCVRVDGKSCGTQTATPGTSGGSSSGSSETAAAAEIVRDTGQSGFGKLKDRILSALTAPDGQPGYALSNIMAEFSVNMDAASFGGDNFILSLYFGAQTWSFFTWNASFGNSFRAADGLVSVVLDIDENVYFAQVPHLGNGNFNCRG